MDIQLIVLFKFIKDKKHTSKLVQYLDFWPGEKTPKQMGITLHEFIISCNNQNSLLSKSNLIVNE